MTASKHSNNLMISKDISSPKMGPSLTLGSTHAQTAAPANSSLKDEKKSDLTWVTDVIDTHIEFGAKKKTLSFDPEKRRHFFATHSSLHNLLLREVANPLLRTDLQSREGEYYLTYEALTLLVNEKIAKYKTRKDVNCHNIFVLKLNSTNNSFINILKSLHLQDGDDAKFILFRGIHSIALYIRNIKDKIHCFILDSEPTDFGPNDIQKALQEVYGNPLIIINNDKLQFDFFSCNIFAIKALMFFIKNGNEVFAHCRLTIEDYDHLTGIIAIDATQLTPTLLKLCQNREITNKLSAETLKAVVSKKTKKTLKDYLEEHKFVADDKTINTAAFKKRYQYMNTVAVSLQRTQEQIQPHMWMRLPVSLIEVQKKFSSPIHYKKTTHFLEDCDEVRMFLQTQDSKLSTEGKALYTKLKSKFPDIHEAFKLKFKLPDNGNHVLQLLWIAYIDESLSPKKDLDFVDRFFDKIYSVLQDLPKLLYFLKKHWPSKNPLQQLSTFELPSQPWNTNRWVVLLLNTGERALKLIGYADLIDKEFSESGPDLMNDAVYHYLLKKYVFLRHAESEELFQLCVEYNKSADAFNNCLDVFAERPVKKFDILPEMILRFQKDKFGNPMLAPGSSKDFYYTFAKYSSTNLRGLFLGDEINCCQTIDSEGEACALEGLISPFSCFYVIQNKRRRIIGVIWAWIGKKGELVFDSLEILNKDQEPIFKIILDEAARQLMKIGFSAVLIGEEGGTPQHFWPKASSLAKPRLNYREKSDADESQLIVAPKTSLSLIERVHNFIAEEKISQINLKSNDVIQLACQLSDIIPSKKFQNLLLFLYRNGCYVFQQLAIRKKISDIQKVTKKLDSDSAYFLTIPDDNGLMLMDFVNSMTPNEIEQVNLVQKSLSKTLQH